VIDSNCNVNLDDAMMFILLKLFLNLFWTELPKKMKVNFYKYDVLIKFFFSNEIKKKKQQLQYNKMTCEKMKDGI
jgi:hypothetical protein